MRCKKARILLSLLIDDELDNKQRQELEMHLSSCDMCNDEYKAILEVHHVMKSWKDQEPSEQMFSKFTSTLNSIQKQTFSIKKQVRNYWTYGSIAATAAALIILGLFFGNTGSSKKDPVPIQKPSINAPIIAEVNQEPPNAINQVKPKAAVEIKTKKITQKKPINSKKVVVAKRNTARIKPTYKRAKAVPAKQPNESFVMAKIDPEKIVLQNIKSAQIVQAETAAQVANRLNEANIKMNETFEIVRGTLTVAADLMASENRTPDIGTTTVSGG